jgi:pyruvate dehydrogenase E2 component (dihydrolipoamide acetyltransferase)
VTVFLLPDLGEGLHEAEIISWHVSPGDHVVGGQPLVEVETDKAVVDIPSPQAGRIAALHGEPGELIEIGAPLVEFGDGADPGAIVGELATTPPSPAEPATRVQAPPAVRALARRLDVDLATVDGSGPGGRVTTADVEHAAAAEASSGFEPLRGPRLAMARNMARAHEEAAPATVNGDADIDAWPEHEDTTIRLVRAITAACAASPSLNAWLESHGLSRRLHDSVDVGVAVETPDGLFVPVLRDVAGRDAAELRGDLDALEAGVRDRSVRPEDLRDATIGLSNFGVFGGRHASMIVPPPTVAIVGAGRAEQRVVAREGEPAVRRVLPLSLTFDHRAVTGGEAAEFLAALVEDLERAS